MHPLMRGLLLLLKFEMLTRTGFGQAVLNVLNCVILLINKILPCKNPGSNYPFVMTSSRLQIMEQTAESAANSDISSFSLRMDSPTDRNFFAASLSR